MTHVHVVLACAIAVAIPPILGFTVSFAIVGEMLAALAIGALTGWLSARLH